MVFFPDINGTINLQKDNISFEKALDLILKGTGIPWYLIDGVYYIGNPPVKSPIYIKMSSPELFHLQNISSKGLIDHLPWPGKKAYYTAETESSVGTSTSIETVELGAGLTVVPYYIGQNKIKIEVEAEFKNLEDNNRDLPVILSRDTKTTVIVDENHPTFITGANTTNENEIRKILLEKKEKSTIPDRSSTNSELVIFLQAERKSPSESPFVVSLKGDKLKLIESPSKKRQPNTSSQPSFFGSHWPFLIMKSPRFTGLEWILKFSMGKISSCMEKFSRKPIKISGWEK